MSDTKAKALGLTPLARIVSTGVSGLSPEIMGLGPIQAVKNALKIAGKSISDIDLFEINEAFAVQVLRIRSRTGHRRGQAQHLRWRDRAGSPLRYDRCPYHQHPDQQPAGAGQDLRRRDHVCRRRTGHGNGDRAPQLIP